MTDLSDLYNECFEENEKLKSELAALRSPAPAATVTGWRPEWGMLDDNDTIQAGDEYWDGTDWYYCMESVGELVGVDVRLVRRRLTPPSQGDEMRALCDAVTEWANNVDQYHQRDSNGFCLVGDDDLELLRSAVAAVRGAGGEVVDK